jgi:uncharacterized 2Fe-2S/4Fe-4S cluster protein (DUF4445 family)
MEQFEVKFQPDGLRATVPTGTLLADAMKSLGMHIQFPCGGAGKCGKCAVEIHPFAPEPTPFDLQHLTEPEIARGMRLACRTKVDRPMSVLISPGMRVLGGKILVDGIERVFDLDSPIRKAYLELPEPTLDDQAADLHRIARGLGRDTARCPAFDIDLLRELPAVLRSADFKVTVTTEGDRIIGIEPGDTTARRFGIAFDIGTTTVVGTIHDLSDGAERSRASRLNAQVVYGEDTISRIRYAIETADGRADLTEKIRGVANEIIDEACARAGIDSGDLYEAVFVGNTTMSHLFLGLDPRGLSCIPFVPVTGASVTLRASEAGIRINPRGSLYVLPNIAGFVGSDTVGVMLACSFLELGPPRLAVDVGTNGELALRTDGGMMVCSTAAGPALEGAALACGMRAANGAIEHVDIADGAVECDVIGGGPAVGLCGSGIIDLLAELLDEGIVDATGRLLPPEELTGNIPESLLVRVVDVDGQPAFVVSRAGDSDERDVVLTQRDIRQIQLAKGAISAGIELILKQAGLIADDLHEVLLAGAFGNYIRTRSARRIGLLPPVPDSRIRFVGNAASTGAKMALLSSAVREDADRIRRETKHIELAALPEFMNTFMDHMLFPE